MCKKIVLSVLRSLFPGVNTVCLTLSALLFFLSFPAKAQQVKTIPTIGYLVTGPASCVSTHREIFLQALEELGYFEGQNLLMEYRHAEDGNNRLPDLATDLVRRNVDIIVAGGTRASVAAKNATGTIPIVMVGSSDPLERGLVRTLARPGGNLTGLSTMNADLAGKRLQILQEAFPNARRFAVLWYTRSGPGFKEAIVRVSRMPLLANAANSSRPHPIRTIEVAARPPDVRIEIQSVLSADGLEEAFSEMHRERVGAFTLLEDPLFNSNAEKIVTLAAKNRLAAIYPRREFVNAGGLMSYGPDPNDLFRRAATYVDKILKGAKPADLPAEQPTRFELVINLKGGSETDWFYGSAISALPSR